MRSSTSDNYLTSGIAYAFHPHRDTWYSAPQCQLNWWLPIYAVESDNVMAFHPRYWTDPVKNSSRDYNYYQWNATSRKEASKHVKKDTRKQPKPEEPMELDPQGARGDARRRRTRVLRRSDALERAEHLRRRRASASTSARSTRTTSRRGRGARTSTRSARARRCATTCA